MNKNSSLGFSKFTMIWNIEKCHSEEKCKQYKGVFALESALNDTAADTDYIRYSLRNPDTNHSHPIPCLHSGFQQSACKVSEGIRRRPAFRAHRTKAASSKQAGFSIHQIRQTDSQTTCTFKIFRLCVRSRHCSVLMWVKHWMWTAGTSWGKEASLSGKTTVPDLHFKRSPLTRCGVFRQRWSIERGRGPISAHRSRRMVFT